jgi:hypothetical protein
MKSLRQISRVIIGLVFIFSGTVKAIDPLGTVYKLQDYFHAFHLPFLKELSLVSAILLCTAEFIAGVSVLFSLRPKQGILLVLVLMGIFTPLTFILALTNPVSDCGCFGDAIHLTNWQTFFKNIILLIPAIWLFRTRNEAAHEKKPLRSWIMIAISATIFVCFIFYNLRYLPVVDFLPYKVGVSIPDAMKIPEGSKPDRYNTTFIYAKDGDRKEFTLENYPAGDTAWKFVEQKSVLVEKGYQPPIHDFSITTEFNDDITDKILSYEQPVLLMICRKLETADKEQLRQLVNHGYWCMGNAVTSFVLTSSASTEVRKYSNGMSFCYTDETTLKTMMRANVGYILLKKGKIAGKWSWAGIPPFGELHEIIFKP